MLFSTTLEPEGSVGIKSSALLGEWFNSAPAQKI